MNPSIVLAGKTFEVEEAEQFTGSPAEKKAQEAIGAGDWERAIYWHPRPLRLQCFTEIIDRLPDSEYWRLLAGVWIDTEAPGVNEWLWRILFGSGKVGRENLMTPEEHRTLEGLPDPFTIYRGASRERAQGMSWTLDEERAAWFARRFGFPKGDVFMATIPKRRVLAVFLERRESEVVIDPRWIRYRTFSLARVDAAAQRCQEADEKYREQEAAASAFRPA